MKLYPYQQRVKALIQSGRSVILQAPTGAGKTRAALAPFIEAFFEFPPERFPKQAIYSVPMRVLATQFTQEYSDLAARHQRLFPERRPIQVKIQTGEQPDDRKFLGDLIFATIDQTLSSALGAPYSLSSGRSNLNAGAFYASYLIFDEFHLFPVDARSASGALTTTLQLLSRLKGLIPFILMTATFSSGMLQELARLLNAEVVTVPPEEYEMIASLGGKPPRQRIYHVHDAPISAQAVLAAHQTRSIAICNQVARAQQLFAELREMTQDSETEVMLLHSRFTQDDRKKKEARIRREFGKEVAERQSPSLILVATQVVEVGLDITSENLHTEIAPANAVLQRAGRCARYPGEQGHVHIYPVPQRERRGETRPDFMPYPRELGEKAWESFSARDGMIIDFQEEQRIIDEVHLESDRRLLAAMERQAPMLWDAIYDALEGDLGKRQELIRKVDSITVLAAEDPAALGNPFKAQGFSLWRGTVKGMFQDIVQSMEEESDPLDDADALWGMQKLSAVEPNPDDPTQPILLNWERIDYAHQLDAASIVVIQSRYCAYDEAMGFRLRRPGEQAWGSQPGDFHIPNSQGGYAYDLESYPEHIRDMVRIYRQRFRERIAYVDRRLEAVSARKLQEPIAQGSLDRAIRAAIALHDVAKMDTRWQKWVRLYQEGIGEPIPTEDYMAVHTHWDPDDPRCVAARNMADKQVKRPPHAGESAVASARILGSILAGHEALGRAAFTAIVRHHSASAHSYQPYHLHPAAAQAVTQALREADFPKHSPDLFITPPDIAIENYLSERTFWHQLLYLLVVRYLRLADNLSQAEKRENV